MRVDICVFLGQEPYPLAVERGGAPGGLEGIVKAVPVGPGAYLEGPAVEKCPILDC